MHDTKLPRFAPPGAFARDLQSRLRRWQRETGAHRFADGLQWAAAAALLLLGLGTYTALLAGTARGSPWASAGLVLAAALSCFWLLVVMAHDAAHGSVSRHGWVNRAILFTAFGLLGVSGALWRDRHIRLHHPYPNLPGTGVDADGSTLLRLAPDKARHRLHAWQPFYALAAYALGLPLLAWVEDFALFRQARHEARQAFARPLALVEFAAAKALHVGLFLLLPWLALDPPPLVLAGGYLMATGAVSLCFAVLVIGTHVSDLAEFPQPDTAGLLQLDWAGVQLATAVDWAPASALAARLTGGANGHAAHHLFPAFSHRHGPALSVLVAEAAAAHGLRHRVTSFTGMVGAHLRHLGDMARALPPTGRLP